MDSTVNQTATPATPSNAMIPWPVVIQLVAPFGVDLIEYVVGLIQKDAQGQPITAADWNGLATLHASKTGQQVLAEQVAKLPNPA